MKGFVPTPPATVRLMVEKLFAARAPRAEDTVLDPGCGDGPFIAGVLDWCRAADHPVPRIVGVELHPGRAAAARERFRDVRQVKIVKGDFLEGRWGPAAYVIGNPPYVPITGLSEAEKMRYRQRFKAASGRFDLYGLFFEHALASLAEGGRLVFVTPEKYLSVGAARPLRSLLSGYAIPEITLLPEDTFPGAVTYPAVTVVDHAGLDASPLTRLSTRAGHERLVRFSPGGEQVIYQTALHPPSGDGHNALTLEALARRISCGVATGADRVFVLPEARLPEALRRFAHPTISGRQLSGDGTESPRDVMLVPYDKTGRLLPEADLGTLLDYLAEPERRRTLLKRTCVQRKPWYAFHETPPLSDLLRPKLLCKDITDRPHFWIDRTGEVVPRHSVYYLVPHDAAHLDALADWLNAPAMTSWLIAHAQPAANGFRRIQSTLLRQAPAPPTLHPSVAPSLFEAT